MRERTIEILAGIGVVLSFIAIGMACFNFGVKVGTDMNNHEYRLMLNEDDTELLFETLDEIVSRNAK